MIRNKYDIWFLLFLAVTFFGAPVLESLMA